jgi:hypothetical protein
MTKKIVFERRKTVEEDVVAILKDIREFSRNELFVVANTEEEALRQAVAGSRDVWSGFANNKLVLMYGVRLISIISNHAYLWMITTELAEKHWVTFIRATTLFAWELLHQYDKLTVISPMKSHTSQKWLKYIGFEQEGVVRMHGVKFKRFSITKEALEEDKMNWLKGDFGWQPLLAS